MLTVNEMVPPSAEQFEIVFHGIRLPMKSGDRTDSRVAQVVGREFKLGVKDKELALDLTKRGTSHRKFLRQLPVIMEINAPLYWWKQMDKYQIGTVTNSESTMHTLLKKPFSSDDFSDESFLDLIYNTDCVEDKGRFALTEDFLTGENGQKLYYHDPADIFEAYINYLNLFRDCYLAVKNIDKKNIYFHVINDMLPQSYNQTRCWSGNYEVLLNIIQQRKGHKLGEWKTFIDYCLENIPYLKEFYDASCSVENDSEQPQEEENERLRQQIKILKCEKKELLQEIDEITGLYHE